MVAFLEQKSKSASEKTLEKKCCMNAEIFNAGLPQDCDEVLPDIGIVDLSFYNPDMIKVNMAMLGDIQVIAFRIFRG